MAEPGSLQLICVPELGVSSSVCPGDHRAEYVEVSSTPTGSAEMSWELVGTGFAIALLCFCIGAALAPLLWIVAGRPAQGL